MSEYEYTDTSGDALAFTPPLNADGLVAHIRGSWGSVYIPNADVPTVAAELLKAAGRSELAELLEAVEADIKVRTEREAAEKKLQERRDALAKDLSEGRRTYGETGLTAQAAIDRIIELEDGKADA